MGHQVQQDGNWNIQPALLGQRGLHFCGCMQESTQAPGQIKTSKSLTSYRLQLQKITGIKPPSCLWPGHKPRATEPTQHRRDCDKKGNSRECNHNIVTAHELMPQCKETHRLFLKLLLSTEDKY